MKESWINVSKNNTFSRMLQHGSALWKSVISNERQYLWLRSSKFKTGTLFISTWSLSVITSLHFKPSIVTNFVFIEIHFFAQCQIKAHFLWINIFFLSRKIIQRKRIYQILRIFYLINQYHKFTQHFFAQSPFPRLHKMK